MDQTAKVIDSVGNQILKAMMVELSVLSPRYGTLSQDQQQETIDRLRDALVDSIDGAVRQIAAQSYEALPVQISSITIKDGTKISLETIGKPAGNTLYESAGMQCMLIFCDPEGFKLGLDSFKAPAKQRDAFDE